MGNSNLTCIKQLLSALCKFVLQSCPFQHHITMAFYQLLRPKPWSHSWLLFSFIPPFGPYRNPASLNYCLLGSTRDLCSLEQTKQSFEITSRIISFPCWSLQFFPCASDKIQNLYHSLQISLWSGHTSLTWSPTPLFLTCCPTPALWAIFQTSQVYSSHGTFASGYSFCLECSFLLEPQGSLRGSLTSYQSGHTDHSLVMLYHSLLTFIFIILLSSASHNLAVAFVFIICLLIST